jgi:hypothetical protein
MFKFWNWLRRLFKPRKVLHTQERLGTFISIYLGRNRSVVQAELLKINPKTSKVMLPDGNIILRKKRDIVKTA